jgi:hypothetical protein
MNFLLLICLLVPTVSAIVSAAELKPETLNAWKDYVHTANSHMKDRLHTGAHFLWLDESPDRRQQVRSGEILVAPFDDQTPARVPSGLIHHWIGAAFIPNVTLSETLAVVRDYTRYPDIYPAVVASKSVSRQAMEDKFSVLMMNNLLVEKKALETENASDFFKVNNKQWYSFCRTTRVQQIDNYGQPNQHKFADGEGTGYIWRLYSITRFQERDGGVYVELEALALTRDIPVSLRWVAGPVVRRISRNSVLASLRRTQGAVESITAGRTIQHETIAERHAPGVPVIRSFQQP